MVLVIETFRFEIPDVGIILWNITLAKDLIEQRSQDIIEIVKEEMVKIVLRNEYDHDHSNHVDPSIPGIGAPIVFENTIIYMLIDGIHRCARALRDNVPFYARLLTDDDARACILQCPEEVLV